MNGAVMDLLAVRKKFVKLSGHYDLVEDTTDWADNGADFYIQAGQEFLDRRSKVTKQVSRLWEEIAIGAYYVTFQRCRTIEEVYVNDDSGRSKLVKKDFHWLHEEFSEIVASGSYGTPLYYCPAYLRTQDNTDMDNLATFFNYVMSADDEYRGVLILPPPDEAVVVEVFGKFYSADISSDDDESFWTINHPSLLILASLYQLEILGHRNTQGANDYLGQLEVSLADLDMDLAEEESHGVNQIEG
jgi:hypothetical protein